MGLKFCAPSYPVRSGNFVLMPDDGTLMLKTGAGAAETQNPPDIRLKVLGTESGLRTGILTFDL